MKKITKQSRHYFADVVLYLADPVLAKELGAEPVAGISPAPFEHEGCVFEPGDRVSCDFGFSLVYEGEFKGEAMCHHVSDLSKCRRRFSELIIEEKAYVQRLLGWVP